MRTFQPTPPFPCPLPPPTHLPYPQGNERPLPRSGHASCCIRDRVFVFGGVAADGVLLNDVWTYDGEGSQWSHVSTFGTVPSPRTGGYGTGTGRKRYACHRGRREREGSQWIHASILGTEPSPRTGEDQAAEAGRGEEVTVTGGWGHATPGVGGGERKGS